ncbi:vomeronasal type-1 receptor 1-like [Macrotis lagotis]|uniref:vomeronasal type-1 receptor 1-like n=1 Tax=Macrotis lagotis TaxID=92651 RepID=UPI003D695A98
MIYPRRVYRGLSLCSTCILSGYQTIAIRPSSLKWTLKTSGPKCIFPCCVLCWILNLLIEIVLPLHVIGLRNSTNSKGINKLDHCSLKPQAENALQIQLWKSIYVTMCVVFMVVTSGYMIYILYRHHQRVQHIHGSLTPRASPEIRATKVILMLVSIFFLFNTMCSILTTYADYSQGTRPWILHIATIMSMSFQVLTPFVLIKGDSRIPQIFCGLLQRMRYLSMTSSSTISHQTP